MTFSAPRVRPPLPRPRVVIPIVVVVVALILLLTVGQNIYVDLLFYQSVHFTNVFTTVLWTRVVLFAVVGLLGTVVLGANLLLAYKIRPSYIPTTLQQRQLDVVRTGVRPYRIAILIGFSALIGLFFGVAAQQRWATVQLFLNGQSFGVKDPQFHRDLSYYMFTLPFERMILTYLFAAVTVALLFSAAVHFLYGGIQVRPGKRLPAVSPAAKAHLSALLGIFVMLKAFAYYLDRFGLLFSGRGRVTGAGYADVHATLPSKNILIGIAAICALMFFANAFRRGSALPVISFGLLVLSAVLIGGAYPAIVQQFKVKPNEISREAPYIARNIDATRVAYGIVPKDAQHPDGTVVTTEYAAATPPAAAVRNDTANVANARLLDPAQLQATYEQLQQLRAYYGFSPSLDIDRYAINGTEQAYLVAAREVDLTGLAGNQKNWPNEHLVYTHGQGFVASPVTAVDPVSGQPGFTVQDIPPTGPDKTSAPAIPIDQARVYYGELSPTYSVVNTKQKEVDGLDAANYSYEGEGGVGVGSKLFRRLALAVHFKDYNLFFSSALTSSSQILYNREPRDRVGKAAPWLKLDGDPYPAMINGRLTWIVDGYTTSDDYPYSERVSFGQATGDAVTKSASNVASQSGQVNYIRNSVKATVDAFTGKVTLYAFEQGKPDPLLRTWEKVFPGSVQPESSIPADLRDHLRYPEDLFKVQRELLTKYHVSDPKAFYQQGDFWQVPDDPTTDVPVAQPAYYSITQMPGQAKPTFNLTTSLTFASRPNLAAVASVSSDAADYGVIRVLDLPDTTNINGPRNVENQIQSDTAFKPTLTLLNQNGSSVVRGNLQALPVGGGFLFVQPFYAKGTGAQTYPTLKYVVVVYGDRVGFAPTLAGALTQALAGGGGTTNPPATGTNPGAGTTPPPPTTQPTPPPATGATDVGALAQRVAADADAVRAAKASGDLKAISDAQAKYSADLAALVKALNLP